MADETSLSDRIKESLVSINTHPGQVAYSHWRTMWRAWIVYSRNLFELQALLNQAETDAKTGLLLSGQGAPNDEAREAFMVQLDQRLHNIVAGTVTVVDHTRFLLERYEGEPFYDQFQARNKVVRDAPVSKFIRTLRNVILHNAVTPFSHGMLMTDGKVEFRVSIPTAWLLSKSSFGAEERRYIEACGPNVRLSTAINDFADMMLDLYTWALEQFNVIHGAEYEESATLAQEHNDRLGRGRDSDPS